MVSRPVSLSLLLVLLIGKSGGKKKTRLRTTTDYYDYSGGYDYTPNDFMTTSKKDSSSSASKKDSSSSASKTDSSSSDEYADYDYERYDGGMGMSETDYDTGYDGSSNTTGTELGAGGIITYIDFNDTDTTDSIDNDDAYDSFDETLWGDNFTFFKGLPDKKYKFEYDESPSFPDEMKLRGEIGDYFEDVQEMDNICDNFFNDFGVDICEMEGGWRNRNRNGRFLAPIVEALTSKKGFPGTDFAYKTTSANICEVHNHFYSRYENRADKFFERKIRFLVADPNFDWEDLTLAIKALDHFNYCTENMIDFEFEKFNIPIDVSEMNWMYATYDVLLEAESMGISFTKSFTSAGGKSRFKFNTGKHMTMIILPDDVNFEGHYGFATLHYGLSVLKSSSIKNRLFVLHEIGHNLGMKHSSSPKGGEYGDNLCIMGGPKRNACFNGPKSFYLGLYMDYTAVIKKEQTSCYAVVTLVDLHNHLNARKRVQRKHIKYNVILVVKIPYNDMVETVYMMYYRDTDIVAITTGETGVIQKASGEKLLYSDISQRVFDLRPEGSIVYAGVLIKRCPSLGVGRVLVSFDPNAPHRCESIVQDTVMSDKS